VVPLLRQQTNQSYIVKNTIIAKGVKYKASPQGKEGCLKEETGRGVASCITRRITSPHCPLRLC